MREEGNILFKFQVFKEEKHVFRWDQNYIENCPSISLPQTHFTDIYTLVLCPWIKTASAAPVACCFGNSNPNLLVEHSIFV